MYASKLERGSRCFAHQFQSLPCFDAGDPKLEMTLVPSLLMMRCTCACREAHTSASARSRKAGRTKPMVARRVSRTRPSARLHSRHELRSDPETGRRLHRAIRRRLFSAIGNAGAADGRVGRAGARTLPPRRVQEAEER